MIALFCRLASSSTLLGATSRRLEAILWDMDGVLADTERDAHRPAFNQAFMENNLDTEWSVERYGKLLETGGGKERMTAHWTEVGWPDNFPTSEEARQEKIKELHLRKTAIFNDLIQEGGVPLRPGVLRIIDDAIARGTIRLAVCSTSSELAVRNLVNTLMGEDRASYFEIFAGDMVQRKKPAPDVYNMAVDHMQLDKSKCVIVEDSHIGLGAALAAGISCIVTKSSYTANEDFTGAKMIVEELGEDPSTGVTLQTLESLLQVPHPLEEDFDTVAEESGVLSERYNSTMEVPPEDLIAKEKDEDVPLEPFMFMEDAEEPAADIVESQPAEEIDHSTPDEPFKFMEDASVAIVEPQVAPITRIDSAVPKNISAPPELPKSTRTDYRWKSLVFWKDANLYGHTIG